MVSTETTVATLDVPAGSFVVFAKVLANNNSGSLATVTCRLLSNGAVVDAGADSVRLPANFTADRAYLSLAGTVTSAGPAALTVACRSDQTPGNWISRVITAVKVGAVN